MAALLAGIPAGILSALIAWFLGADWLWVLAAYAVGGTVATLGVAVFNWFLKSGHSSTHRPAVGESPRLARAPTARAKQLREP